MSNKSLELYLHLSNYIKFLLEYYSINFNLKDKYFMIDFEKSSRKAFKLTFPEAHLFGCYFHYIKALWNKAKKEGLTKKPLKLDTYVLIFSFKLYQFIPENQKKIYLTSIINSYSDKKEYNKFFKYFIKNWSLSNFLNHTDNSCEIFHKILNDTNGINLPKISFLLDNLKIIT